MIFVESVHWLTSTFLQNQKRIRRKGPSRWISQNQLFLYEWDSLHGEIEVYNKKGKHVGVLNADGSPSNKPATEGRKIDV